jgi:ribosomal protein L37AE/L43A
MEKDKRIGKILSGPAPRCKVCSQYLEAVMSLAGDRIWHCKNCHSTFEKKKVA